MGLLNRIKSLLVASPKSNIIEVYLKDNKCGKMIKVILRKSYEISRVYEEQEEICYMVNKVVICDKCFNRIRFNLGFDKNYRIVTRQIEGGSFLTAEEYNQSQR